MVNGEWLLSLKYYYAESARAEFLSHYTWKCMVPTRGHRGDPPKEATCYVSIRRGGTKDPSLNASKNILIGSFLLVAFV